MFIKTAAACLLLLAQSLCAAVVSSSVVKDEANSVFHYTYTMPSAPLGDNREISNIEFRLCGPVDFFDLFAAGKYTVEARENQLKFDAITPDGDLFVFGFSSYHSPESGVITLKAGRLVGDATVLVPSCLSIPEPSIALCLAPCLFLLLLRSRKHP